MSLDTEIDITALVSHPEFDPWQLSNSRANLGDDAGRITWRNSCALAKATAPCPLDTEEKRAAFRDFVKDSGGWSDEEIAAWSDEELNALFIQWVAGDIRECFGDDVDPLADDLDTETAWAKYQEDNEKGVVPSRLFRSSDHKKLYFDVGN